MAVKSAEVLYSLRSDIADAEVARRDRHKQISDALLERVQSLIVEEGLEESVGVSKIPYNGGTVFRLRGPEGRGVSYTIGSRGVEFKQP